MPFGLSVFVLFVLFGLVSYLLGSISFAVIFTRKFAHTDVRSHGSGNAGMTNVMRTAGMAPGLLTLAFDVLKAAVAVFLGYYVLTWLVVQNYARSGEVCRRAGPGLWRHGMRAVLRDRAYLSRFLWL